MRMSCVTRCKAAVGFAGIVLLSVLLLSVLAGSAESAVEAVEISRDRVELLPKGKEADGIIGDFLVRNQKIHALISANLAGRKANYATERSYPTPGCVYDLDLAGGDNDQLTVFRPGGIGGELSYVRILSDGKDGAARVEAVRTAARGDGVYTCHEYRLEPGWQHLLITSTYRNESSQVKQIFPHPMWKAFSQQWKVGGIHVGDSIDPIDKRAYAWTFVGIKGASAPEEKMDLPPGLTRTFVLALAVADSPAAAYGYLVRLSAATGRVEGRITEGNNRGVAHAALGIQLENQWLPAYPDASGHYSFQLPSGDYSAKIVDPGRPAEEKRFSVKAGATGRLDFDLPPATAVTFNIRDEAGHPSPTKVQFVGLGTTPSPKLGFDTRARGCDNNYFSENGQFTQQIPEGHYLIKITRGPEYDLEEREVELRPGQRLEVNATLKRVLDTQGWISTDYHSHTTESGDNNTGIADRLLNLAAEHIEFAPATEHNRIADWQPHLEQLGLKPHLKTVSGLELTKSADVHMNAFPLPLHTHQQDGGAPAWQFDPRLMAIMLRRIYEGGPERWVHLNHPEIGNLFNDRNEDRIPDGGYKNLDEMVDAVEAWSTEILNLNPWYVPAGSKKNQKLENRTFGWLQLLNQGRRMWIIAVSDSHRTSGGGVGGWRTYVRSSTDNPAEVDPGEIIRNSKAGRMIVTNGPFLTATTSDGNYPGSSVTAPGGYIDLKIRVQVPNWMEIDRVQVLVNGRPYQQFNYTRKSHPSMFRSGPVSFDQTLRVHLQEDAHLIVVAVGEHSDLSKGWAAVREASMRPLAYTNPISVDINGDGFRANGDTLGHPLLVAPDFPFGRDATPDQGPPR